MEKENVGREMEKLPSLHAVVRNVHEFRYEFRTMIPDRRYAVTDGYLQYVSSTKSKLGEALSRLYGVTTAISRQHNRRGWKANHEELRQVIECIVELGSMFSELHRKLQKLDPCPNVLLLKAGELITRYEKEMANLGKNRNMTTWILIITMALGCIALVAMLPHKGQLDLSPLAFPSEVDMKRQPYLLWCAVVFSAAFIFRQLLKAALDLTEAARRVREGVIESKSAGAATIRELGLSCGALQEPLSELVSEFKKIRPSDSAINSMLNKEGKEAVLKVIINTKGKVQDIRGTLKNMYDSARAAAKYVHVLKDLGEILDPLPKDSIWVRFKKLFGW